MKIYLLFLIQCFLFSINISAQDNWASEGSLGGSTQERHRAVGFSIGSKGYVGTGSSGFFGGTPGWRGFKDFWEYDPITKVWTQKADIGGTQRYDAVGFSIGNKGYVGIGRNLNTNTGVITLLGDFLEYDPSMNTWTSVANMLGGPRADAVAIVIGEKAYVGTGLTSSGPNKDWFEFNPENNAWVQKKAFEGTARQLAAGFSICNRGFVGTGLVGTNTGIDDFWEYDPKTNDWLPKNSFDGGASYATKGFSICTKGYFLKGAQNGVCDSKKFWEYDPFSDTWIERASFPSVFKFFPVAFSILDKGYVGAGKLCGSETYYNDFLSYTPIEANVPQQPMVIEGSINVCSGTTQAYYVNSNSCATSYTWSIPPGSVIVSGQGDTLINITLGQSSGNISVTANNGCGSSTAQTKFISVTITPAQPGIISGIQTLCADSTSSYSIPNIPGLSYSWSWPTGWVGDPQGASISITPNGTSGTISVVAINGNCSSLARNFDIHVNNPPNMPEAISGDANVCLGALNTYSINSVPDADTYTWSWPEGTVTITDPSISIPALSSGVISVFASNGCGFSSTRTLSIIVKTIPEQPGLITGPTMDICQGTSNLYFTSPVNMAVSYTWQLPESWVGNSASNFITPTTGNLGGSITVVATNECGDSPAQILQVTVNAVDTVVSVNGASLFSNAGTATYQWIECSNPTIILGQNQIYTATVDGYYAVIVQQNGCIDTSNCHWVDLGVGINEALISEAISIYPNPTQDNINISIDDLNITSIEVSNLFGQKLITLQENFGTQFILRTETLLPGVYFILFKVAGRTGYKKFIKS